MLKFGGHHPPNLKLLTLKFKIRVLKKTKEGDYSPIYVRLYDGAICDQTVKDPNLVSALTGHVEGSRAFTRYRTIDIDMKKDLVKILEGAK